MTDIYNDVLAVDWQPIESGTYHAIYAQLYDEWSVFSTHTCMEGCEFHSRPHMLTAWGLKGSPVPIIKSVKDDGNWTYYLAKVIQREDSDR